MPPANLEILQMSKILSTCYFIQCVLQLKLHLQYCCLGVRSHLPVCSFTTTAAAATVLVMACVSIHMLPFDAGIGAEQLQTDLNDRNKASGGAAGLVLCPYSLGLDLLCLIQQLNWRHF